MGGLLIYFYSSQLRRELQNDDKNCLSLLGAQIAPGQCGLLKSSIQPLIDKKIIIITYLMFIGPCIIVITEERNQLDATFYFVVLLTGSTCFGHYYAHHQELVTIMLITTFVYRSWFAVG